MRRSRTPTRRRSATTAPAPATARAPARGKSAPEPALTYDDLLAIVRLIESGSRFTDFRLRSGEIEVEIHRANGAEMPVAAEQPAAPVSKPATAQVPVDGHVIRAPMVGTFYRCPEPGAPPFVKVGTRVKPDSVVCIIEVMKLMNSVTAGVSGIVTQILVDNAHMVEYGQPLIAIRPK
jgi:acetyl-CoA carboxylase biotin carboxyl carrier protein